MGEWVFFQQDGEDCGTWVEGGYFCFGCGKAHRWDHEPRAYRICYECHHEFWTRLHLWWKNGREWKQWKRPSRVYSCPICTHDF